MPGRTKQTPSQDDVNMDDVPTSAQPDSRPEAEAPEEDPEEEQEEEQEVQRVRILPGSTDSAASFEFTDEGHTLGNALRADVEFCAYSIPHPSEPKMNIRIQTYSGTAVDALQKGLADLQDICDVVADEFSTKRQAFNEENGIER
ncbi:RNA polymerase rpb3/Rpb11 dimerization domain-containing protein [Sarocladium implicatum]|nr:RNA polymerase rpb3/Rpb11 dimerization domain-containing protein [Sarocladium implicatum]